MRPFRERVLQARLGSAHKAMYLPVEEAAINSSWLLARAVPLLARVAVGISNAPGTELPSLIRIYVVAAVLARLLEAVNTTAKSSASVWT